MKQLDNAVKGKRTKNILNEVRRLLSSAAGAFIYALGINMFVVPSGIYSGGLMGICQVIRTLMTDYMNIPPGDFDIAGILYYIINVPILIMAWFMVDRGFVLRTLVSVTFSTIFLSVIPTVNLLGGDMITSCLVGGVICGSGTGLTLWSGCSSGGTDVIGMMISHKKGNVSIGKVSMIVNLLLYGCCILLFNVQIAIYSIVYSVLYSFALDRMHFQNINEEVIIMTKKPPEELESDIMSEMKRGVTRLQASGGFTGEKVNMLMIVISKFETQQLRAIVHKHDPQAFVTIKEHTAVYGNYMKKI